MTGLWAEVDVTTLTDEAAIRSAARQLKAQGMTYAILTLKDTACLLYTSVDRIQQSLYFVEKGNKKFLLPWLIKSLKPDVENALVFSRTKHGADKIAKELNTQGIPAAAIHGNKSQTARVTALEDFKAGKTRVLAVSYTHLTRCSMQSLSSRRVPACTTSTSSARTTSSRPSMRSRHWAARWA